MSETGKPSISAKEAARTLADLEGYEEALTAKTAGLTWIVWGTAIPGLFATYNAAGHWVIDHGAPGWTWGSCGSRGSWAPRWRRTGCGGSTP